MTSIILNPAIMHIAAKQALSGRTATEFRHCVLIQPCEGKTRVTAIDGHRAFLAESALAVNLSDQPVLIHARHFCKAPPAGACRLELDLETRIATFKDNEDGKVLGSFSFDIFSPPAPPPDIRHLFPDDWQFKGHSPILLNPRYLSDALALAIKYADPFRVEWFAIAATSPCMVSFPIEDRITTDCAVTTRVRILIMPISPGKSSYA